MSKETNDGIFKRLDIQGKGYLSLDQLRAFFQDVFQQDIDDSLVEAALKATTSGETCCSASDLALTVTKVSELQKLQERVLWEFRALDRKNKGKIRINDALLLFRSIKGDQFSLAVWHLFLSERGDSSSDVNLDEITLFLMSAHNTQISHPAILEDYFTVENELTKKLLRKDYKRFAKATGGRKVELERKGELKQKAQDRVHCLESGGLDAFDLWIKDNTESDGLDDVMLQFTNSESQMPEAVRDLQRNLFTGNPFSRVRVNLIQHPIAKSMHNPHT